MQRCLNPEKSVKQDLTLPFFLLVVALVALAFTAIFIKLSLQDISANATLFNRLWIATVIFGVWNGIGELRTKAIAPISGPQKSFPIKAIALLILIATIHVSGRFLMTWSLTQTTVAKATLLANMPPIFTMLGAWLILKQRFSYTFIAGTAIALVGALTLSLSDMSASGISAIGVGGSTPLLGDAAALLSSVFYAASFLMIEELRRTLDAQRILFWRCLIGAVIMAPVMMIGGGPILPTSVASWVAVAGLAAICEALGHGLVVYSLKYFSSTFVNVFLLLESILTAVFAYFIFSEGLSLLNFLTFAMILGGVLITKLSDRPDKAIAAD